MSTTITKHLIQVNVYPEYAGRQNVVRHVMWAIKFERAGFSSTAFVETFLDADNISEFVPANEIGTERLLQWAFEAQGGDAFLAHVQPRNEEEIDLQIAKAGQVPYTDGFDLFVPKLPIQAKDSNDSVQIFPTPAVGAVPATVFE